MKQQFIFTATICIGFIAVFSAKGQDANQGQGTKQVSATARLESEAKKLMVNYCFDCHDENSSEAGFNLESVLAKESFDGTLVFENLIKGRMPPKVADQPTVAQKRLILEWLAKHQVESAPSDYRRIGRHEFVNSLNDLLGTDFELARSIPEDRGTFNFDSDRRIKLTRQMLAAYFSATDELLEFAFPNKGYPDERIWTTNKIKDSHHTYNVYARKYKEGMLFSWTRANNGNSYSFFYDEFESPERGWYDLTLEAAKLGDFPEDVSVLVYAGKYYFADDRPQPQRLLGVISLGDMNLKTHTIRGFLHPGENISVHCYSKHTWRQERTRQGAYIKQLQVCGPVFEQWPPRSFENVFAGLSLEVPARTPKVVSVSQTVLEQIGGSVSVSSFQKGMEKERMLDGSNKTFWHTRFEPTVAKPPHYVILKNPQRKPISGLSYSTWSGGNGNGQVKTYSVSVSDDGENWEGPIVQGSLEVRLAAEQQIWFPAKVASKFIKFLVTDAVELNGKSLASIGKLDVLIDVVSKSPRTNVEVASKSKDDLRFVIRRFAEATFSSTLSEDELAPYYRVSLNSLADHGDFIEAAKIGMKSIIGSHRFLLAPGVHSNDSYRIAAKLARALWLSVPDRRLLNLAKDDRLSRDSVRTEIDRMLLDDRAGRMVHSFCAQWLNLRSFNKVSPSLKLYPNYDDLLNHYLPIETEAYLNYLIKQNLPVSHLIDSEFSFLNQRLAQHYGIDGVIGQEIRRVAFETGSPRGGLLTMGSVLKVTSDGFATSPILRGAWISRNIAGNTLSPPPENVEPIEPDSNAPATLREQIEEHKSNDTCYACHKRIDPYGFALENFDATGRWRTRYRVSKSHPGTFQYRPEGYYEMAGQVDASGEIDGSGFANVIGLKKILLSDHKQVAYNLAKKFFEYANGYKPTLVQRLDLYEMIPENSTDCRIKDLITEVLMQSFAGKLK